MKKDVQQFVHTCQTCIQAKADRSSYPSTLQPLPVPSEAWEIVTMDFIEGLPKSATASCILVVVDKFTLCSFPSFGTPLYNTVCDTCVFQLSLQTAWIAFFYSI
jgi:hypothetical protein